MALTGNDFLLSAKGAWATLFTNPARYILVNGIGCVFSVLGKMFISLSSVMVGYLFLVKDQ